MDGVAQMFEDARDCRRVDAKLLDTLEAAAYAAVAGAT